MRYYPLFLDLRGRPVLLVGAGSVAWRKFTLLERAGADVRVVAPTANGAFREAAAAGRVAWTPRAFAADDIADARFVIAATSDASVNADVAAAAESRRIPVNVVDAPALCSAILPAIVDRDPVLVAIGTEGTAPVLARRLRERIEALLEPSLGALARLCQRWRARVAARLPEVGTRRRLWEQVVDGAPASALRAGREADADEAVAALLARSRAEPVTGEVALVGAGPGDPGLLTLHALRAIQDADVVFHDALVSDAVLELVRRDAEKIAVGKRGGGHSVAQDAIHDALLEAARAGRRVVRLKGGDPLTFARGGEELQFLRAHGVSYRIVPGITAASACAAYAGIPLTHRDHAQSLRYVTAHCANSLDQLDWPSLAAPGQTLAVYMGVALAGEFSTRLRRAGMPAQTPVAVVENGSRPGQRVVIASVQTLAARIRETRVQTPAMMLIGGVCSLAADLHWFGRPPETELAPATQLRRVA